MNITAEIVQKFPDQGQIVVRYYTDIVTPDYLAVTRDVDNNITLSRGDYPINFKLPFPSDAELIQIIQRACPWKWLEDEEKLLLGLDDATGATDLGQQVAAMQQKIADLPLNVPIRLNFTGLPPVTTQSSIDRDILRIDGDVDQIYAYVIGNRSSQYTTAEAQARTFAANNYEGTVPQFVQSWLSANTKGLTTAQAAADDLIAEATNWRQIDALIYSQRLLAKKGVRLGVANTMQQWTNFVSYIRTIMNIPTPPLVFNTASIAAPQ